MTLFRDLFFVGLALFNIGIAAALLVMPEWSATWLPWADLSPLSHAFLVAISAATGAAIVWIVASREYGAAAAGALDLAVAYVVIAAWLFVVRAEAPGDALFWFGLLCVASALTVIVIFLWSRRLPLALSGPMPGLLKACFAAYAAVFLLAGLGLLLGWPHVMPWAVEADFAPVLGGLMLGAATYFAYPLAYPAYGNAKAQLVSLAVFGFLFLPVFLADATLDPAKSTSVVTSFVVLVSGLVLSLYVLFLRPRIGDEPALYGAQ
ncbi:MAG: hypothetical protein AB7I79_16785 [Rhizobiaceae bacterium]